MTPLWQQAVVALLVAGALLFAFWRLAPDALRLRLLDWLERAAPPPPAGGSTALRRWIMRRRARLMAGGCAGCAPGKDIHAKKG
ncbi:MAG: hypothetical protein QM696_08560 [Steroidobacteraceae bacterium]